MKVTVAIFTALFAGGVGLALEQPKLTQEQIAELDQRDSELFGKIVGTWLFESMGENLVHVAQRTIYRDDGTFISDYRISSAGNIKYRRATGFWYPLMGWFCEEETKSTDDQLIPRMVRWVKDPIDQELKTVSRTGLKAVLQRGEPVAEDFDFSLAGLSEKNFCAALEAKKMIGFVAEDTGMKEPVNEALQRVMPSPGSVVLSYVFAAVFFSFALFLSYGEKHSPGTLFWILGAGWMGRAIEKTSLGWKFSRLRPESREVEGD